MSSMAAIWIPKRLVEVSLVNTAAASAQRFVSHCEIEYESRIFAAAGEILESGCRIVMLTGPSASGKTTTAHKIADALTVRGCPSKVVSLEQQEQQQVTATKDGRRVIKAKKAAAQTEEEQPRASLSMAARG